MKSKIAEQLDWSQEDFILQEDNPLNATSLWFRHDQYRVITNDKGIPYIKPAPGARLIWYNPFNEPGILIDFLMMINGCVNLNQEMPTRRTAQFYLEKQSALVLSFCNRYGQMGLFWSGLLDVDEGSESLWLMTQEGRVQKIKYEKYAARFFPGIAIPALGLAFGFEDGFLNSYSEPTIDISRRCLGLYRVARQWQRFLDAGSNLDAKPFPDDAPDITWKKYFNTFLGSDQIRLRVTLGKPRQLQYVCLSLLQMLEVIFALNITLERNQVRLCGLADCRRPFIASNSRSIYCSPSCSNKARVRRWRQKQMA
jgi:hypothetical protein